MEVIYSRILLFSFVKPVGQGSCTGQKQKSFYLITKVSAFVNFEVDYGDIANVFVYFNYFEFITL